jgi:hypothetical protein
MQMWLVGDAVADVMIAVSMTYLVCTPAHPRRLPAGADFLSRSFCSCMQLMQASTPLAQTQSIVRGVVRLIVETNTFSGALSCLHPFPSSFVPKSQFRSQFRNPPSLSRVLSF